MVLEVYGSIHSPPCRLVYAVLKHLDIPYEQKTLKMQEKEHLQPHFLKLNPFHTIPTIVDDGFPLYESRAIATYLVEKYAPDHQLYPRDMHTRASINRWLYWEISTLSTLFQQYRPPPMSGEPKKPDPQKREAILDKIRTLDALLSSSKYLTGDKLTLADITLALGLATFRTTDLDIDQFVNVSNWLKQVEKDLGPEIWKELVVDPIEGMKKRLAERRAQS